MSLHIYKTSDGLAEGLASWIVGNINLVLRSQDRYSFVLSGGSTPRLLYKKLAEDYLKKADWDRVDFFWGDERFVPKEDNRNNAKMALELLLQPLGIKDEQIFSVPTNKTPQESVADYQQQLENYFAATKTSFDFVLLGMGADAHTLSLFPGEKFPLQSNAFVAHTYNKADQLDRITLLPSIVNRSGAIIFMVQGKDKAATLNKVLLGDYHPEQYPAQWIAPKEGDLMWYIDEAAAGKTSNLQ